MSTFRFAIMGAGNIAHQFCDAVTLVEDCEVSAIASKDLGRAQKFADVYKRQGLQSGEIDITQQTMSDIPQEDYESVEMCIRDRSYPPMSKLLWA